VARILVTARQLGLRVIAGERGSGGMAQRDVFAAGLIAADAARHPGARYVVMYGSVHLIGVADQLARRGLRPQLTVLNFLGRKTEQALIAAGTQSSQCMKFADDLYYANPTGPAGSLAWWVRYLRQTVRP
jgi:hypothetical protein